MTSKCDQAITRQLLETMQTVLAQQQTLAEAQRQQAELMALLSSTPAEAEAAAQSDEELPGVQQVAVGNPAFGINTHLIVQRCKVDYATARRWKSGVSRVPHAAAVLITGDLGAFGDAWQGWTITQDELVSPDGLVVRRDDALSLPYVAGQMSALRAELAQCKAAMQQMLLEGTLGLRVTHEPDTEPEVLFLPKGG